MVSTTCESCGQTIFPGVRTCPHCGAANRLDLKPLLQAAVPLLIGVLALGGLTVMCAPRTKTISCVYTNAPGTVVAEGSDPFTDDGMASNERFSLDPEAKRIEFPGGKEIQPEKVPYTVNGSTLVFVDRFGLKYMLDPRSGGLRVFSKAGPTAGYRLRATASCTGF